MTPAEGLTAVLGGVALAGAVMAVAREAVRRNWIVFKVTFAITAPEARWPKFPKAADTKPKAASPLGAGSPGQGGGQPAGRPLTPAVGDTAALADAQSADAEIARLRDEGLSWSRVAVATGIPRTTVQARYARARNGGGTGESA